MWYDYIGGKFRQDINRSNTLGLNGDLAVAYASLLREIWETNPSFGAKRSSSTSPNDFKVYQINTLNTHVCYILTLHIDHI